MAVDVHVWFGREGFSIDIWLLYMFLYITKVLPDIFPLKWFYSELAFYTKHFLLSYCMGIISAFS